MIRARSQWSGTQVSGLIGSLAATSSLKLRHPIRPNVMNSLKSPGARPPTRGQPPEQDQQAALAYSFLPCDFLQQLAGVGRVELDPEVERARVRALELSTELLGGIQPVLQHASCVRTRLRILTSFPTVCPSGSRYRSPKYAVSNRLRCLNTTSSIAWPTLLSYIQNHIIVFAFRFLVIDEWWQ